MTAVTSVNAARPDGGLNRRLVGVLAIVALVAGYIFIVRPQGARLAEARDERKTAERQLAQAREAQQSAANGEPTEQALGAAVPGDAQLAELLRQFDSVAAETGVKLATVTPSPPSALADVSGSAVQVTLVGSGPREAAYTYVQRLYGLSRLFVVDQVSIRPAATGPAAAGAPAAAPGDVTQLQIVGRAFSTAPATTNTTR